MQNNNQASADESNSGKRASFTKRIAAMSSREPSAAETSFSGSSGLLTPTSSHRRNKSDDYKNFDRQSSSALINNSEQTFPKFEGQLYKWTNYVKGNKIV